ncbi:MAG: site-2 protease family protein [Cyanobacteria bacterium J06643_4]
MITVLLLFAAAAILGWGYSRAKPFGRLGILAWLQTVVLMVPWLLFFGFSAAGVYLNLAGILLLVVTSAGLYIYLGRLIREEGKADLASQRAAALVEQSSAEASEMANEIASEVAGEATSKASLKDATDPGTKAGADRPEAQKRSEKAIADKPGTKPETKSETKSPISPEDLAIVEGIFGIDTFFRTKTVPYQDGAIFKGNLRGEPAKTAQTLSDKLAAKVGDRYCAFLISDQTDRPVVVVLPKESGPKPTTTGQQILAGVLAIATFATCLETAAILLRFDIFQSPERWPEALPIALGLIAVLLAHEAGHWFMARRCDVSISPPFFLPAWQLGSFGSLMRFESLLPNRAVLFDVSFAGPAAGGLLSFTFLFLGLVLSHPGSLFQLPAEFFQGSIFVGTLARGILGDALQADLVDVHPLMIVGWIGLIITAINVMPAGQLDGGRVVQAIYGRKTLIRTSTVTLVLLAIVGLFNPLSLYWAVLIVFLQRQPERPCKDDLTEPNDTRAALTLLALFLMLLVLLPLTPSMATGLGIG